MIWISGRIHLHWNDILCCKFPPKSSSMPVFVLLCLTKTYPKTRSLNLLIKALPHGSILDLKKELSAINSKLSLLIFQNNLLYCFSNSIKIILNTKINIIIIHLLTNTIIFQYFFPKHNNLWKIDDKFIYWLISKRILM